MVKLDYRTNEGSVNDSDSKLNQPEVGESVKKALKEKLKKSKKKVMTLMPPLDQYKTPLFSGTSGIPKASKAF